MDLVIREMVDADVGRVCELLRDCYRWLADRRSYPRYLAMILYHILLRAGNAGQDLSPKEEAHGLVR